MSKDLTEALRQMMEEGDANIIPAPTPRGAQPVARGAALLPGASGGSSGGGGLASPLTEFAYADREFYAESSISSSDGLLVFKIKPIKSVKFIDANGGEAKLIFKAPT